MKFVIVGGVATGAAVAARLRRLDEHANIIVLEKTGYVSYANCGLPYYIGDVITDEKELTLQTPKSFKRRFDIDVRVKNEVISIDRKNKTVSVKKLEDGEVYEESYDKLVLAQGAKANWIELDGVDKSKIFAVKTVEDTFAITDYIKSHDVKTASIFGGGFIGIEVAENIKEKCENVYVLERGKQILSNFDYDMALQIESKMRDKGVEILKNQSPADFLNMAQKADMVIMSIGVLPQIELAKEAGLAISELGTIEINERMQTSDPDIYAGGDAVAITDKVLGKKSKLALAGPAGKQGRIIADNIAGLDSKYEGAVASSILKVFDITAATTGINEVTAKKNALNYDKVIISANSHATYYPDATGMFIKLIFEKNSGKILGAQIVGRDGVDKRIDVLATAIYAGLKATDLKKLDLAYAPPYSSAKDPVNMLGFVAENVLDGKMKQFFAEDVAELEKREDVLLLDARTEKEYSLGHFRNSINIPIDELRDRISELEPYRNKKIYVNCHSGLRSYITNRILSAEGFDCYNLAGGYAFYSYLKKDAEYDMQRRRDCGVAM